MSHHTNFSRGESGVHTVEGNIAGVKAARLAKKREKDQEAFEAKKQKMQDEAEKGAGSIDDKFNAVIHNAFGLDFVGLKTKEEYKVLKEAAVDHEAEEAKRAEVAKQKEKEEAKRKKRQQVKTARLSFAVDDEEEDEESDKPVVVKKKALKNPEVETNFLRDPERERQERELREKLKQEWLESQERIKQEMLEVTYSYWDGSGHRREIKIPKGTTVGKFLEQVRMQLVQEFADVRSLGSDDLMYIKEDLIIPHNYSFYDLIVTKARGKSGPLFHFDVHDDVRVTIDTRIEKDESHPGKIVDRKWYERNKHIFPASRWEIYDPNVERGSYTIHGGEVTTK